MTIIPDINWLGDLTKFAVNRVPAHSDHLYYETVEEARRKDSMPLRHSLNGNWKFHYSVNPKSRPDLFYRQDFDCSSWNNIIVPGHIQLQGYGIPQYVNTMYPWDGHHDILPPEVPMDDNSVGSYVKTFYLPKNMDKKPVFISFQGVESAFYVWLNGHFVGYSEDSFTPAEFELTPYIQDGENKLAVEVYQRSTGSWLEDQDFWRFSGIFRDVYLYTVPKIHAFDVQVLTELDANFTKGKVNINLRLQQQVSENDSVIGELYDMNGKLVGRYKGELKGEEAFLFLSVDKPILWSAENPYLYPLYIHLYNGEHQLVEVIPQKIGFRRFELVDKIMRLNGERIVFKGVNRHEFNCRKGRAITKEDMLWDIMTLKQNNINAVRTSHYPNQSEWYDLCDEYGIYVIDEMNLETHGSWQKMGKVDPSWNIPGSKPEWEDIVMDRATSMYERDKNHPSILIWSCGNESFAGEVILNVSRYFKRVDPSRLVHYEGVFHAREYNDTSDMESRMYAKPVDIENYLSKNPEKPYISCEYMHAMGNSLGGMEKYTALEKKYPMYQGGFIWDFIDQSLMKKDRYGKEFLAYGGDFGDRPTDYGFCTNGIVYADRQLSPKMQEVKFLYQNIKLIVEQYGVTIQNEHLFTDTSAYYLEYILYFEGKEMSRNKQYVNVEPQSEHRVEFNLLSTDLFNPGEYCIHVTFKLKEPTLWAEAGHEIAFGQHVFRVSEKQKVEKRVEHKEIKVVNGDVNIGVHGQDFSIIFSKQVGSLISMKYSGHEMVASPFAPLFWRATTDNDRGFMQDYESGLWYAASLSRKCVGTNLNKGNGYADVAFTYKLSISKNVEVQTIYTVFADGRIRVRSKYQGDKGLPQMPIFAQSFKVPADYDQLEWYAYGPEENYVDRFKGARLGIFHNQVSENVSGYVMPQESGNRTGVRWVNVSNKEGNGIRISSLKGDIECSISPFTAFELENAKHHYELPNVHYTVVTVAGKQMGVGGDDSWGAPVHDQYLIQADEHLEFEFWIEGI